MMKYIISFFFVSFTVSEYITWGQPEFKIRKRDEDYGEYFKIGDLDGYIHDGESDCDDCNLIDNYSPYEYWHLDRINQKELPLDSNKAPLKKLLKTDIYVWDTNLYMHDDFKDKIKGIYSVQKEENNNTFHGTHVMGSIIGENTGIVDTDGYFVNFLGNHSVRGRFVKALQWTINNIKRTGRYGVVNMSFGGERGSSTSEQRLINYVTKYYPIIFIAAAGNEKDNACSYSPAYIDTVITVGASNSTDDKSEFSNWGSCIDLFSPGSDIVSTNEKGEYSSANGTSMASPIAASIIMQIADTYNPDIHDKSLREYVMENLDKYLIKDIIKNSNNTEDNNLIRQYGNETSSGNRIYVSLISILSILIFLI